MYFADFMAIRTPTHRLYIDVTNCASGAVEYMLRELPYAFQTSVRTTYHLSEWVQGVMAPPYSAVHILGRDILNTGPHGPRD